MYGLPQAGTIAQQLLKKQLQQHGYHQSKTTPSSWKHDTRPISFTLVVDSFGGKYVGEKNAQHLLNTVQQFYKCSFNWDGKRYCGLTIKWDYKGQKVYLLMHNYINKAVNQFQHTPPQQQHQKQHYVPYYLSIVCFLSLKYAFGIISMLFTLVRCSIILSRLFLTYLHPCFLPYVRIYQFFVRLLMSHEKCLIWQVLFIIKFATFAFFFCIVLYSLQVHNVLLQMSKMLHPFFPFCLILLVSTV